jgi:hypothetical protein
LIGSMRRFKCGDAEAEFAEGLKEVAPNRPAIHSKPPTGGLDALSDPRL